MKGGLLARLVMCASTKTDSYRVPTSPCWQRPVLLTGRKWWWGWSRCWGLCRGRWAWRNAIAREPRLFGRPWCDLALTLRGSTSGCKWFWPFVSRVERLGGKKKNEEGVGQCERGSLAWGLIIPVIVAFVASCS